MANVFDAYLADVPDDQRAEFERVRDLFHEAVPGLEEVISYKMPGFALDGKDILWIGCFKRHMSIFPGTVKFTPQEPLTDARIRHIAMERAGE